MFTKDIEVLENKGFVITKLPMLQTQVTHRDPFVVESTGDNVQAVLLEDIGWYSMIFSGYPIGNELQESIQQHITPLIHAINDSSKEKEEKDKEETDHVASFEALFSNLKIGDSFTKEEGGYGYKKVTETTCTKEGSPITSALELPIVGDTLVFVESEFGRLTPDQKADVVKHVSPGLQHDDFAEEVLMQFENIAGMDTLSDDQIRLLVDEMYEMYTS